MKIVAILLLVSISGCTSIISNNNTTNTKAILWTVSWSPDGSQIAAGGVMDTLLVFSGTDYSDVDYIPFASTITQLKWHPASKKLAISSQISAGQSAIYDFENKTLVTLDSIGADGARGLGWNYNGSLLAVGDYDGALMLYDEKGSFIRKINTAQKSITGLSWHPKKNVLAVVGSEITIMDLEEERLETVQPRAEEVLMLCVSWHPSGDYFVTGDYGDFEKQYPPLLQFWNANGHNISKIEHSKTEFRSIAWNNTGNLLATASDKIRLFDGSGNLFLESEVPNQLWGLDWNPTFDKIVTSDAAEIISIWDAKDLSLVKTLTY